MTQDRTDGDQPHANSGHDDRPARGSGPPGVEVVTDRSEGNEPAGNESEMLAEPGSRPRTWPRVVGVLILLLGAGGAWIWQNPDFIRGTMAPLWPWSGTQATGAASVKALEARVARLEQRPPPADLSVLIQRLDALENRGSAQPDMRPLMARLDALEARMNEAPPRSAGTATQAPGPIASEPDLRPVMARLDGLEKSVAAHTVDPGKVDAISSQVQALTAHQPDAALGGKLDELEHRLAALAADDAKLAEGSDHANRLARLEAAEIALAAGHPLGPLLSPIANLPPALTRFATTAPPTEAALRLAYTPAAQAALKVSRPDTEGKPFLDQVMARLQDFRLITVREGDHVLVGNSAAALLVHARVLLDAGDLDGAIKVVSELSGPVAAKMAPWLANATALAAAREALAALAEAG